MTACSNRLNSCTFRLALAVALASAIGLAACCGGGGDAGTPPPEPPVAPAVGDPVTATIGPAGGSVAFTASGVAGSLSIPAGALATATVVTVTPLAPDSGEWARVRIDGPTGLLDAPATLSLQLAQAAGAQAGGVRVDDAGTVPLVTTASAHRRSLAISVQAFADSAATGSSARSMRALAAAPLATPPTPPPKIALKVALTAQEKLDALRRSIEAHEKQLGVRTGLDATLAAVTVRQMIGSSDGLCASEPKVASFGGGPDQRRLLHDPGSELKIHGVQQVVERRHCRASPTGEGFGVKPAIRGLRFEVAAVQSTKHLPVAKQPVAAATDLVGTPSFNGELVDEQFPPERRRDDVRQIAQIDRQAETLDIGHGCAVPFQSVLNPTRPINDIADNAAGESVEQTHVHRRIRFCRNKRDW